MVEFPGQVLELSMSVGRGIKGPPRPPVGTGMDGYRLSKFEGPFYIISSCGCNSPASICPYNCSSVNISCYRISFKTTGRIILKRGQNVHLSV